MFAFVSVPAVASAADDPSTTSFIKTSGTNFTLEGRPFFVTGINNHYLTYGFLPSISRRARCKSGFSMTMRAPMSAGWTSC
ncbi:MAG: hypothetical protein E5V24_02980 [Mesorhizobium sp.]|nr:MAG: hypothetical protein E5V24_02980 [Mesorhizobium sp.]